ncbi:CBS domain-containing protein [Methylobacterium oxalidis]|uniref:CBS domain-containing protein n=1 Tax=Methylobacterium oxalidis TaxID=944322 RepID=UPI0033154B00
MSRRSVADLLAGRPLQRVSGTHTVAAACHRMREEGVGALAVFDGTRLVGILSERDIALRVIADHRDPMLTLVRDVMTRNPATIPATADAEDAFARMLQGHCRHLPVTDGEEVVGMLSIRDLPLGRREPVEDALNGRITPALG